MSSVVELADLGRGDLSTAGGKGANLGELIHGGFPVPEGFVVTTRAYAKAVRSIATDASAVDADDLRRSITQIDVPTGIRSEILAAYERLGRPAVAVRSSATAEDLPGAAFAGQQDTFLNVRGPDELIDAVRRCWASLWTDRAIAYRDRREIAHADVRIAVVVQVLVDADIAGVLFTADPVTGDRSHTVIDASPGLGEAVVSGLVTPDHHVVDEHDRVIEHRAGRAEVVVRSDLGGGVVHETAGGDAALSSGQLTELARTGRAIAAHFGAPQDIEWAYVGGRLWILQARPLTALPPEPRRVNRIRRTVAQIVAELMPVRPYPIDMSTWTVRGHGRILTRMLAEIPAIRLDLHRMLPEPEGVVSELVPPDPHPTLRTLSTPFRAIGKGRRFRAAEWTADPRFARFDDEIAQLNALDVASLSWPDLVAVPDRVLASLDGLISLRVDFLPGVGLSLVGLRLRLAVLGLVREAGALTRGVRSRTQDANAALTALARAVAARPEWAEAFGSTEPAQLARDVAERPEFADLRPQLAAFVAEYGHREARSAFLVSEPTWGEDPQLLYGGIATLLKGRSDAAAEPGAALAEAAEARVLARRRVRVTRSGPGILAAARAARAGIAFREDTHFHAPRGVPVLRSALREAGRRLAAAGALDDPADVLHLRLEELMAVSSPDAAGDRLRDTARARKARRARYAGAPLISPATLMPRGRPQEGLVSGMAAGGGRASGPVRVIRDPGEFTTLRTGEVLVCPYTNPSWTPLFQLAAAVVVDTGGLASHAAIVAREYGIPAVMGTGTGTRVLRDGDLVTVDGDAGVVRPGASS